MSLTLGNANLPGNPEYVRKTGWLLLLWLAPYFALGIADGIFLPELARHQTYFWVYDFAKFVVIPTFFLFIFRRYFHLHPDSYLFTGYRIDYREWEWIGITFLSVVLLDMTFLHGAFVLGLLIEIPIALVRWIVSPWFEVPEIVLGYPTFFTYGIVLPDDRVLRATVAIFFGITAGIVEEIFFRGVFRQIIVAILGPQAVRTYIIASALVFGLGHWEQGSDGLIGATAFGLCAAWLFLKLGDLRPLVLAHALIDIYIYW